MNISFLFTAERLRRVQLWFYEGASEADAREAVGRVLDYLQRTAGSVTLRALPGAVTAGRVMEVLQRAPVQSGSLAHVEILTPSGPRPETWFSRVGRHSGGYMVMLFADAANQP